jgi:hypothetical protein
MLYDGYVLEQCGLLYRSLLNCYFTLFLFNRIARQEKKRKGRREKRNVENESGKNAIG